MIYDDLNGCTHDELLFLIDKLREKLAAANDRLVLLDAEADRQFMNFCEAQEEVEHLRTKVEILENKNEKTISLFEGLLTEVNKIQQNLPSSIFVEVKRLEGLFKQLYPDREGLPF